MKDIRYKKNVPNEPIHQTNEHVMFKNTTYPKCSTKQQTDSIEKDVAIYIVEPIQGKWGELDPEEDDIRYTKQTN